VFKPRLRLGYHRPQCNTEYILSSWRMCHTKLCVSVVQSITEFHKPDVITNSLQGNLRHIFITYVSSAQMITKLTKQCDVFPCNSSSVKIQQLNLTKRKENFYTFPYTERLCKTVGQDHREAESAFRPVSSFRHMIATGIATVHCSDHCIPNKFFLSAGRTLSVVLFCRRLFSS